MTERYADLRAALDANDITESSWLDRESVRALLAERDALREALESAARDLGAIAVSAYGDYAAKAVSSARAALTQQEQGK